MLDRLIRRFALPLLGSALLVCLPLVGCGGTGGGGGGGAISPAGCGCMAPGAVGVPGSTPIAGPPVSAAELALIEEVFAQVNAERVARGLAAFTWSNNAAVAAYTQADYLQSINSGSTHDNPVGCTMGSSATCTVGQRLNLAGQAWTAVGENVAAGQMTAQEVMCGAFGWMNSAGHCANLVSQNAVSAQFTQIGIACRIMGGGFGIYWAQVFFN